MRKERGQNNRSQFFATYDKRELQDILHGVMQEIFYEPGSECILRSLLRRPSVLFCKKAPVKLED